MILIDYKEKTIVTGANKLTKHKYIIIIDEAFFGSSIK